MKTLSSHHYVPSLRWRQAEYLALDDLKEPVKDVVFPLLTIPDIVLDVRTKRPKRTLEQHVAPFPSVYRKKWQDRPAWLTLEEPVARQRMADGEHVLEYIFRRLRDTGDVPLVPTLGLDAEPLTRLAVANSVELDRGGAGVIVRSEDLASGTAGTRIRQLLSEINLSPEATDVLVDLVSLNYDLGYPAFSNVLAPALRGLRPAAFRNLVLLGTAIPTSLAALPEGSIQLPRHEWLFYRSLLASGLDGIGDPTFGDHTMVHPDLHVVDPRVMRPVGKVVYTTPSSWAVRKGDLFIGNQTQMHGHCREIVTDPQFGFRGADFSWGDERIQMCADGDWGPSNLPTWKRIQINHHITTVTDDLATLRV